MDTSKQSNVINGMKMNSPDPSTDLYVRMVVTDCGPEREDWEMNLCVGSYVIDVQESEEYNKDKVSSPR